MEMKFFSISDKCAQDMYALHWHPGQENLADYQSKHHTGTHHAKVRPWYLHESNSLRELPRALKPSALKGCVFVGTQDGGYLRKVPLPLPRIPLRQRAALAAAETDSQIQIPDRQIPTLVPAYSQVQRVPTWSDLTRTHLGVLRSSILPIAPRWLM
jgi:hypothetical protein